MEYLLELIMRHAHNAHWYVFVGIILAGFNIPLSTDLLILLSAFIAATILPEHTWHLLISVVLGCYLSAWCAYWMGRLFGSQLSRFKWFQSIFHLSRMKKIRSFYERYGFLTLLIGRFIPFGVRNCIFMSSGMSRFNFLRFIFMDAFACLIWSGICFYLFYSFSQFYTVIWQHFKTANIFVLMVFGVTVIAGIWYKQWKRVQKTNPSTN